MAVQGDHGLRRGQRDHVHRAAEGEQSECASVEATVVHHVEDGRTERERGHGAEQSDTHDDEHQATESGAELLEIVLGRESSQTRQEGGLYGLEQEEWDAREQHTVSETGDLLGFVVGGQHVDGDRTGVHQSGSHHRAEKKPAEIGRDFAPRSLRAGARHELATRPHDQNTRQG